MIRQGQWFLVSCGSDGDPSGAGLTIYLVTAALRIIKKTKKMCCASNRKFSARFCQSFFRNTMQWVIPVQSTVMQPVPFV